MLGALFEGLGSFVGQVIFEGIGESFVQRLVSRRLRDHAVECDLRAASGRVYNIGTEWSTGIATVTPGHISFEPSQGIVGKREIIVNVAETIRLGKTWRRPNRRRDTVVVLVTPKGQLEWSVETRHLEQLAKYLRPSSIV